MHTTNLPRVALAIVVGTIVGAILVALWSFWGNTDLQYLRDYWHRDALIVFSYAALVWGTGLIVVAPAPWAILHYNGMRSCWIAIALGAILTFVTALGLITRGFNLFVVADGFSSSDNGGPTWIDGRLTRHGWAEACQFVLICSALGGFVGLVVWRIAYRRASIVRE